MKRGAHEGASLPPLLSGRCGVATSAMGTLGVLHRGLRCVLTSCDVWVWGGGKTFFSVSRISEQSSSRFARAPRPEKAAGPVPCACKFRRELRGPRRGLGGVINAQCCPFSR